jgi:hypothetical protein
VNVWAAPETVESEGIGKMMDCAAVGAMCKAIIQPRLYLRAMRSYICIACILVKRTKALHTSAGGYRIITINNNLTICGHN